MNKYVFICVIMQRVVQFYYFKSIVVLRLRHIGLYSHLKRRERYIIIYLWRIAELQVPNLDPPIEFGPYSDRKGRLCKGSHVTTGHLGTLCFNSFRRRACRLFNSLLKYLRIISNCNMSVFN